MVGVLVVVPGGRESGDSQGRNLTAEVGDEVVHDGLFVVDGCMDEFPVRFFSGLLTDV
jgi:hypothetical protein